MDETRALELLERYGLTQLLPAVLDGDLTIAERYAGFDKFGQCERASDQGFHSGEVMRQIDEATYHQRTQLIIRTCWYPEQLRAA